MWPKALENYQKYDETDMYLISIFHCNMLRNIPVNKGLSLRCSRPHILTRIGAIQFNDFFTILFKKLVGINWSKQRFK